jgi:hypothetical protein
MAAKLKPSNPSADPRWAFAHNPPVYEPTCAPTTKVQSPLIEIPNDTSNNNQLQIILLSVTVQIIQCFSFRLVLHNLIKTRIQMLTPTTTPLRKSKPLSMILMMSLTRPKMPSLNGRILLICFYANICPLHHPTKVADPQIHLSRITEHTEDSLLTSSVFSPSNVIRLANPTPTPY